MDDKVRVAVPPSRYVEADTFDHEQNHLFSAHWWLIGIETDFSQSGDYICSSLGRASVIVVRDEQGGLRGYHNICRHRAGPLVKESKGRCRRNLLVCRYHGWCYDLQGRLRNAHTLQDRIDPEENGLLPVRVASWNGLVFVCAGEAAPALEVWLGDLPRLASSFPAIADMLFQQKVERIARTNWKCYGDNSCEGYHVSMVHQALSDATSGERIDISSNDPDQYVRFDVQYTPTEDDPSRHGRGLWIYKFPGLLLHFSEYGFNAESVVPVAVGELSISRWFWFDKGETARLAVDPRAMVASSAKVIDEDIDICERVYRNMCSGYARTGMVSVEDEPGTAAFQQWVSGLYPARERNVIDAQ